MFTLLICTQIDHVIKIRGIEVYVKGFQTKSFLRTMIKSIHLYRLDDNGWLADINLLDSMILLV